MDSLFFFNILLTIQGDTPSKRYLTITNRGPRRGRKTIIKVLTVSLLILIRDPNGGTMLIPTRCARK
jgi:hypothetical protein